MFIDKTTPHGVSLFHPWKYFWVMNPWQPWIFPGQSTLTLSILLLGFFSWYPMFFQVGLQYMSWGSISSDSVLTNIWLWYSESGVGSGYVLSSLFYMDLV